jgi:hypothetical protein
MVPIDPMPTAFGCPNRFRCRTTASGTDSAFRSLTPFFEAIDQRDPKALQSLYDDGVVGTAGYSVESPFVFVDEPEEDEDEDEDEDDLDPVDQRFLEAIKQAKTRYILRVRIRSSNQSFRFQNVLWEAIGRLSDGLLVDPQTAEIRQSG